MKNVLFKKSWIIFLSCLIPFSAIRKRWRAKHLSELPAGQTAVSYGIGNSIFLVDKGGYRHKVDEIPGLHLVFSGSNSTVEIYEPFLFNNCQFIIGNNSRIRIKDSKYNINNMYMIVGNSALVEIGKDFSCIGCNIENHDESGLKVSIGDDCMFSYDIKIRTSDAHTIYNADTGELLNKPKAGVNIGNHVWVGSNVLILKDVSVPDNTIIGAGAIVTKSFDTKNIVLAGIPANIIKSNVNWSRKNTEQFVNDKQNNNLAGV